jgi:glycosyltransferase involved in cell wall biosynthesis
MNSSPNELSGADEQYRRVLHVIRPTREGAIGGASLHVVDLATEQQRFGQWHPLIWALGASDDYVDRLRAAKLDLVRLPRLRPPMLLGLPYHRNIDLVHAHGYEANYLVALLRHLSSNWSRLPTVITAHGWIENTTLQRLKSALDRRCARTATIYIASAKSLVPRMQCSPDAALVIHNGVPPPNTSGTDSLLAVNSFREELGIPAGLSVIGTIGRLSPEKRVDLFLQAARTVSIARPDTHFLVVGGGDERARLEGLARHLGIGDRVTFTGLVREMTPIYATVDLLIHPSETEATPRAVLEAMAHRVPVIATAVGDVPVLLDHGRAGVLVVPDDADALGVAAIELLACPARARSLADRAFARYLDRHTIEIMRRQVEEAYQLALRIAHATLTTERQGRGGVSHGDLTRLSGSATRFVRRPR